MRVNEQSGGWLAFSGWVAGIGANCDIGRQVWAGSGHAWGAQRVPWGWLRRGFQWQQICCTQRADACLLTLFLPQTTHLPLRHPCCHLHCAVHAAGSLLLVLCLVMAGAVLSASFAVFLVRERESRSKAVQASAGQGPRNGALGKALNTASRACWRADAAWCNTMRRALSGRPLLWHAGAPLSCLQAGPELLQAETQGPVSPAALCRPLPAPTLRPSGRPRWPGI